MANKAVLVILVLALAMAAETAHGYAPGLRVGFYKRTCPRAEDIVRSTVESHFQMNPVVVPKLLRMHFHDCFVQGCDGSILIDGDKAEKTAIPNLSLGPAFPVIDDAKAKLEAACPGVVSCADIVALAARDSVVLTKGLGWKVPTGRRDGRVSSASDTSNLPSPFDSVDVQKQKFSDFGLNTHDLVTLLGGHTIGTVACQFVTSRLYDFNNTVGASDPAINPSFLPKLKALCPQNGDGTKRIFLDNGSGNMFDTSYFSNLKNGRGVLGSDQALYTDASTRTFIERFLGVGGGPSSRNFGLQFGKSMVRMGDIGVKTGVNGEIRKVCTAFN
ncbi:hypothetical protein MLD38_032171 [Melastoma candidum]|uniref:Uncharacterized protein n=1 Tax=Melastoma candidum TaxID=119954 RepID=A0ACB9M716_9MYRT|nr:hypothetical protein MLD38_032171 [Melastoma candidum]